MYPNLEMAMRQGHITNKNLAAIIGVAEKTMNNKLQGRTDFLLEEAKTILDLFPQYNLFYLFERADRKEEP